MFTISTRLFGTENFCSWYCRFSRLQLLPKLSFISSIGTHSIEGTQRVDRFWIWRPFSRLWRSSQRHVTEKRTSRRGSVKSYQMLPLTIVTSLFSLVLIRIIRKKLNLKRRCVGSCGCWRYSTWKKQPISVDYSQISEISWVDEFLPFESGKEILQMDTHPLAFFGIFLSNLKMNFLLKMGDIPVLCQFTKRTIYLGGGFKDFWFSPRTLGKWSNLTSICFKWVGSTTN